jgi:hypothetical protein
MSYLDRVNDHFWNFDEAVTEYTKKNNGSRTKGISALSFDLQFKKGRIANTWRVSNRACNK